MKNDITTTQDSGSLTSQAAKNLSAIIKGVAANPDIDVEKMQQLLDMQERMIDRDAESAFNRSMVAALSEIPSFEESTKGHNYNYATFEQINKVVKPILAKNSLFMTFSTDCKENGVYVTAVITHKDGHAKQTTGLFPADGSGSKNAIQAVGSAISYGKRYMQNALLNITTHGEDDDGFASQKTIDETIIAKINSGLIKSHAPVETFLEYMQADDIAEIPAHDTAKAIQYLTAMIKKTEKDSEQ
jgi:hypothetical protein